MAARFYLMAALQREALISSENLLENVRLKEVGLDAAVDGDGIVVEIGDCALALGCCRLGHRGQLAVCALRAAERAQRQSCCAFPSPTGYLSEQVRTVM